MKKYLLAFAHRGLCASVGGPVVLSIIYYILGVTGTLQALTPQEVALGTLTVSLLAFIAGGITTIYQIERLPLFAAILIHGITLYLDYILIYLLNGWLLSQWYAIAIFTGVFVAGYAVIWLIIYVATKASADRLNRKLQA